VEPLNAAQSSAQGKVQEKGYKASLLIISTTYQLIMTLKDDGSWLKCLRWWPFPDYTIVGVGNTMRETLTSFKTFTIWQIIK
jgi:hypothetical protein